MGWLGNLFTGGDTVRGALDGASNLAGGLRDAITGEEHLLKLRELEQQIQLAQLELNKAESQHSSLFVAGARPAILWVGAVALFYHFLFRPIATGLGLEMPPIDASELWPIMTGMLGLGAMRSWEKGKGVNNRHG